MEILKKLADATGSISDAQDKIELLNSLQHAFSSLGFGSFNLGCHKADKHELALNPTLTTWSDDFMTEYERQNWADFDPNLARAAVAEKPMSWSNEDRCVCRHQQSYLEFLRNSPLKGGLMIPLARRPGTISCVSVESHSEKQFDDRTTHAVAVVANSGLLKAEALGLCSAISVDESHALRELSPKQAEILRWAAEGKSNTDIAAIIGISERVVKYHMSEILRKLGVATRAQAISKLPQRQ